MAGRLVVCPTPIGNLEDVTLRVLSALRDADVIACEDTRRTRTLLERYGVSAPLVSYHEHNEERRSAELVERMQAGETVALVSDAACRSCPIRATCSCARASRRGCRWRCCRGRRRRWPRWSPRRCRPTAGDSRGSCRASGASCGGGSRGPAPPWARSRRPPPPPPPPRRWGGAGPGAPGGGGAGP